MLCSISGNETNDPVISPKSGGIFDRKLALTYVATSGKDPLNDEPLSPEELITVRSAGIPVISPPKPVEYNSIPTMLAAFQNEWDALALEVFTLKKQLHSTREELSLALYKYDAAVRVAAKATREKEEAQSALQQIAESFGTRGAEKSEKNGQSTAENGQNSDTTGSDDFASRISSARESLFAWHKQAKVSLPVTLKSGVSLAKKEEKLPVSQPKTLVTDSKGLQMVVAGDFGTLCLPNNEKASKFAAVAFLNESGSAIPVGIDDEKVQILSTGESHDIAVGNVRQLITHPSEPYFVAITDKQWVVAGTERVFHSAEIDAKVRADIHVDGALLGLAQPGKVDIIDLTTFAVVSSIDTDFVAVNSIKFGHNGYWLFVSGQSEKGESAVMIYDLRKSTLVHAFPVCDNSEFAIDPSCQVLVTCDKNEGKLRVHLYAKKGKKWSENVHVEDCGALHSVVVRSGAEEVQKAGTVTIAGLLGDAIASYELVLT